MTNIIGEILRKVQSLPPLTDNIQQLLAIVADPDHDARQVADIVIRDVALTAEVLRVVNSAAYALQQQVTSLERAIPILGDRTIVGLALNMCAGEVYGSSLDGYESSRGALWNHSLRTAMAARLLARHANEAVAPDEAYTAGILHDIGKAVISDFLRGTTEDMVTQVTHGWAINFLEAERTQLGTDHCAVGAILARRWELPRVLQSVILHHHAPSAAPEETRALVYVVHLADMVSMLAGNATGADSLQYPLDQKYEDYVQLSRRQLEAIVMETGLEFERTAAVLFNREEQ